MSAQIKGVQQIILNIPWDFNVHDLLIHKKRATKYIEFLDFTFKKSGPRESAQTIFLSIIKSSKIISGLNIKFEKDITRNNLFDLMNTFRYQKVKIARLEVLSSLYKKYQALQKLLRSVFLNIRARLHQNKPEFILDSDPTRRWDFLSPMIEIITSINSTTLSKMKVIFKMRGYSGEGLQEPFREYKTKFLDYCIEVIQENSNLEHHNSLLNIQTSDPERIEKIKAIQVLSCDPDLATKYLEMINCFKNLNTFCLIENIPPQHFGARELIDPWSISNLKNLNNLRTLILQLTLFDLEENLDGYQDLFSSLIFPPYLETLYLSIQQFDEAKLFEAKATNGNGMMSRNLFTRSYQSSLKTKFFEKFRKLQNLTEIKLFISEEKNAEGDTFEFATNCIRDIFSLKRINLCFSSYTSHVNPYKPIRAGLMKFFYDIQYLENLEEIILDIFPLELTQPEDYCQHVTLKNLRKITLLTPNNNPHTFKYNLMKVAQKNHLNTYISYIEETHSSLLLAKRIAEISEYTHLAHLEVRFVLGEKGLNEGSVISALLIHLLKSLYLLRRLSTSIKNAILTIEEIKQIWHQLRNLHYLTFAKVVLEEETLIKNGKVMELKPHDSVKSKLKYSGDIVEIPLEWLNL